MNFKPILFSTPMVQALLDGRKIMTRRVVKNPPNRFVDHIYNLFFGESGRSYQCPYGQIGYILWVRESFKYELVNAETLEPVTYYYKADNPTAERTGCKFKPSIYMPKVACRLFIEITDIRVERLQDISEEDAKKEGVEFIASDNQIMEGYKDYIKEEGIPYYFPSHSFRSLWKKINGTESWEANPLVWVIEFKQIEKPDFF